MTHILQPRFRNSPEHDRANGPSIAQAVGGATTTPVTARANVSSIFKSSALLNFHPAVETGTVWLPSPRRVRYKACHASNCQYAAHCHFPGYEHLFEYFGGRLQRLAELANERCGARATLQIYKGVVLDSLSAAARLIYACSGTGGCTNFSSPATVVPRPKCPSQLLCASRMHSPTARCCLPTHPPRYWPLW
jgi:hypothetical protein